MKIDDKNLIVVKLDQIQLGSPQTIEGLQQAIANDPEVMAALQNNQQVQIMNNGHDLIVTAQPSQNHRNHSVGVNGH
jgi:hypothetical protein